MSQWHGGKGDRARTGTYSKQYKDNWNRIFSKKGPVVKEPQNPEEGEFSLDQYGDIVIFKDGVWRYPYS